jgi:hypothetical protein
MRDRYLTCVSSYPTMGRPVNLGYYGIEEVDDFEDVDEVETLDASEASNWYVQVAANDVKVLSGEQLKDFYRLGVINAKTYVWQQGMQQWLPLSTFVSEPPAPDDKDDETWRVLMGPGDVRTLSLEQLDDFFRIGVIDEQTLVWQSGMKEWAQLSCLIGADEPAEESWYALMGPGDVRTLSLEQLDDFYRLDVINEHTPLWQPGMTQWLPLGMVAGIEPATATHAAPAVTTTQPAPAVTATRQVPVVTATQPAPTSVTTSEAPLYFSIPAPEVKRGSWPLRLAVAAGLLITLFRNDVAYSVAQAANQRGQYVAAEKQVLGGPSFGTPRAVEALIAGSGGRIAPVRLPWIVTEMHESAASGQGSKANGSNPSSNPQAKNAQVAAASSASPSVQAVETKPKAAPGATQPDAKAPGSAAVSSLAALKPKPALTTVKPASMPQTKKKRASSHGQAVFHSKGDYYDPLNAAM